MSTPLLATKLYIPPVRPKLVSRPRLIEQLNEGLHQNHGLRQNQGFGRKLTLISAPAGFGKTTLVSEWIGKILDIGYWRLRRERSVERLARAEKNKSPIVRLSDHDKVSNIQSLKIAWLSLDEGDNDPTRFLAYFIAALQTIETRQGLVAQREPVGIIGKGALSALQSPQPPPSEAVLTSLINEIAAIPDRLVLVLDDYHLIEAPSIHQALTFLLEHLPPQMHLIIATREDPHLPLSRLRVRGQVTELRAADLRFTPSEAAEFLNQVMGLDLAVEDVAALEDRTEGWIAGLQLAALSMQGHKDAPGFIKSFTGSHHFVLDYLIEEVLEQQPASVQTFLLQTAVLDQLTAPLCDALTGQGNGQATLEMLQHANLFLIPLDEERRWYRYHHLFSDLLRRRLRQRQPDWVLTLHHRASEWYQHNGFIDDAIEYALRAEDFERAAHLVEEHVDAIWQRGEHAKLRRWLAGLSVELVFSKPQLCIFHAWYLFASGQQDAAEQSLQAVEQALGPSADPSTETAPQEQDLSPDPEMKLRGRLAAIRAFMGSYQGDVPGIIRHSHQALEYLPKQDSWRSPAAIALGDAYAFKGDMAAAYRARLEAVEASKAAGNTYLVIVASLKLALVLREQGRLQRTLEICQQQSQLANECGLSQTTVVGWLWAIWGEVLAETNDLDGALHQAKKGVELAGRGSDMAMLGWSYLCLMRVLFSRGDLAEAKEIIAKIENTARGSDVLPWVANQMSAWQARIWLAQDELEAAFQWVRGRGLYLDGEPTLEHEMDYFLLMEYIVLARVLIAQGRWEQTARLLQRLLKAAEAGGRTTRVIEILLLQALALQAQGETAPAITTLEQALTLAEPGGFVRIFVDEGLPMARLLYQALARGILPDYVRRLLSAFPVAEQEQAGSSKKDPNSELIEPLSERELELLQLIAEGLTNQEIATRLFLSPNTVKVHTRNIYGKLGVHSRTHAVARARACGILASI